MAMLGGLTPACGANAAAQRLGYPPGTHLRSDRPHPAVARIIVPEGDATSFGSGTLVDARDQFGLVITNWHVVRDGQGDVEVVFPDGFHSKARALKVDADWDLAALVIWRPPAEPVPIAPRAPQSGDQLTICGYGQGNYRAATGRCTQYYAPKVDLPQHMVELDVEARQGDSGGPIFNDQGELAGVLFGAGGGTTLGSFGGRVESFLATLAPDIGRAADTALVQADTASESPASGAEQPPAQPDVGPSPREQPAARWTSANGARTPVDTADWQPAERQPVEREPDASQAGQSTAGFEVFDGARNLLAAIGAVAVVLLVLRLVR
jgi:hypothetical protein